MEYRTINAVIYLLIMMCMTHLGYDELAFTELYKGVMEFYGRENIDIVGMNANHPIVTLINMYATHLHIPMPKVRYVDVLYVNSTPQMLVKEANVILVNFNADVSIGCEVMKAGTTYRSTITSPLMGSSIGGSMMLRYHTTNYRPFEVPKDVIVVIMSYLDIVDILNLSEVSRHFARIIRDVDTFGMLWKMRISAVRKWNPRASAIPNIQRCYRDALNNSHHNMCRLGYEVLLRQQSPIELRADLNNLLIHAIRARHIDIVRFLLDDDYKIPLGVAKEAHACGDRDILALICSRSSYSMGLFVESVCERGDLATLKDMGTDVLHPDLAYAAAKSGNVELMKYLTEHIESLHQLVNRVNIATRAAYSNNTEMVRYVFERFLNRDADAYELYSAASSAESIAVTEGNIEMLKHLIDTTKIITPGLLHIASNKVDIVRYLLSIGARCSDYSSFESACNIGDIELVELFLNAGCSAQEALVYSARGGKLDLMEYLVSKGVTVCGKDVLLLYACMAGNASMVRYLKKLGLRYNRNALLEQAVKHPYKRMKRVIAAI